MTDDRTSRSTSSTGWLRRSATLVDEHGDLPHRARLGDRRRRPRRQHGPRHGRGDGGKLDAEPPDDRRRAVQDGRHDARDLGRRRERTALRHVLPAVRADRGRRRRDARRARAAGAAARGARGHRRAGQGGSRRQDDVRRPGARPRRVRRARRRGADVAAARPGRGADAAAAGRDATEPLLALKGRASYLGERSVGHIDPGAASSALLLAALADTLAAEGRT